ncbi:MAG: GTP-binding protein [Pirellulaceae bacterium]|nr:GTP-binding protein [Pirellulaceae bacterium]
MARVNEPRSHGSRSTVRRLTGSQPAAIAVFELHGQLAMEVAAAHLKLRNRRPLSEQPWQKVAFGYWKHAGPPSSPDGASATEDVVFCRTGAEIAELHTHGSPAVAESIFSAFRNHGVIVVDANGDEDSSPAETRLSLPMVLQLLEPAWWEPGRQPLSGVVTPTRWQGLVEQLTAADFPTSSRDLCGLQSLAYTHLGKAQASEVGRLLWAQLRGAWLLRLESTARKVVARSASALTDLDQLLATWSYGKFLSREIQVLITGAPNVGKSSLINALLGYQRNVVSDRPGTTRDLVGQTTAIAGWQFRLIDSAGLRHSDDALEEQGIRRATEAARKADLVIAVRSVDHPESTFAIPTENVPVISVLNKVDLLDATALHSGAKAVPVGGVQAVSTKTGQGLLELIHRIVKVVLPEQASSVLLNSRVPPAIVFAPEIWQSLQEWRERLSQLELPSKSES